MTCSPARLAANKANALKSKGPSSEEGKERSRKNALTHGLTATVVRTAEEEAAVLAAAPLAEWLDTEIAVVAQRISRAHAAEERERENAAQRTISCWDDDRRLKADRIGRGLPRHPDRVVIRLRATPQGCDWLIERWGWLITSAGQEGGWTEAHQSLASDLQGIPAEFRGQTTAPDAQEALAAREIQSLKTTRANLIPCDAFDRETVRLKLSDTASPELRRLLRYEAALHRRLRWCYDQKNPRPTRAKAPRPAPTPPPARPVAATPPIDRRLEPLDDFADLGLRIPTCPPLPGPTLAVSMVSPSRRPSPR